MTSKTFKLSPTQRRVLERMLNGDRPRWVRSGSKGSGYWDKAGGGTDRWDFRFQTLIVLEKHRAITRSVSGLGCLVWDIRDAGRVVFNP